MKQTKGNTIKHILNFIKKINQINQNKIYSNFKNKHEK